jgi:hypothetical protein
MLKILYTDTLILVNMLNTHLYAFSIYEGVWTGRLERELQIVQLSTTRCSCIAIFLSQSSEFWRYNSLCCFLKSVYCCKRIFRYRLGPETFGYTLVYMLKLNCLSDGEKLCDGHHKLRIQTGWGWNHLWKVDLCTLSIVRHFELHVAPSSKIHRFRHCWVPFADHPVH